MKSQTLLKWHNIATLFTTSLLLFTACEDNNDDSSSNNKKLNPPGQPLSEAYKITENETSTNADQTTLDKLKNKNNIVLDITFNSNSIVPNSTADFPSSYAPTSEELSNYLNNNYQQADYIGAVDPSSTNKWYEGWSFYAVSILGQNGDHSSSSGGQSTVVTDASLRTEMAENSNRATWQDTVIIDGPVYVQDNEILTIQAGSVIKGRAKSEGETASSLIVTRGGKIIAEGTSQDPIIFTYEEDPLDGTTSPTTRGRWGGLIILGKASLNSTPGTTSIEGIPTTETRGIYGGQEDTDNSGALKYVSIRHGGAVIGAGNEINGLTLGGVGSGTTLEYIEIIGNKDDGIEFFGGTANVRYLISAYNQDDAVDYDEGFRGFCQFVIIHQDSATEAADRGFECDGGTTPEDGRPFATPMFVNITVIGNQDKRVASIRDNAGGFFYNALFTGSGKGIDIEKTSGTQHSYKQLLDDNLVFRSNVFNENIIGL